MHGLHVKDALRWGARNGASVATKVGAQAGLLTLSQMQHDLKSHGTFQPRLLGKVQS